MAHRRLILTSFSYETVILNEIKAQSEIKHILRDDIHIAIKERKKLAENQPGN